MRVWLQGKKKFTATVALIQATEEIKSEPKVAKIEKEEENKNAKQEETQDEEEKIVTTKIEAEEQEKENEEKAQQLLQSKIEDCSKGIEQKIIKELIEVTKSKTKFLLKLSVPKNWDQDDKVDDYLMLDPLSGENELDIDNYSSTIGNKLKSFMKIQSSKGTIKNFDEIDGKQIFNSSGGSVLAYLQSSFKVEEIQTKMEEKYVNALNRYWGFKIISMISHSDLSNDAALVCFSYFCRSLRGDKDTLVHFTNGLKGMGEYLLTKTRLEFYKIITGIVKQIKLCDSEELMPFLIKSLYWQIRATDYQFFLRTGAIEVISKGSEINSHNIIEKNWGMFPIFDAQDSDETLSHDIVNYLEFLFTSCFGRIYAKSTTQLKISGSETGDKSHKIPKAFSKMNTGIVEALLIKISNTIFEQIEKMLG